MSFRRTESGLSNLYLFFGVDAVVFVEGGISLNREDVDSGLFTRSSSDIRFWQTLFGIYRPERNYQFRSIGSKKTVKSIARNIEEGKITNVVVAMDRDFDHVNKRIIASNNVIYTRGYSWENDAWNITTMIEAYCSLSGACKNNVANEIKTIEISMDLFSANMHDAIRIEAILSQYGISVFDRAKPRRYVLIEKNGSPNINLAQVKKSLSEAVALKGDLDLIKSELSINVFIDCFGHLLAEYAYRLLAYLIEKVRKMTKLPKEYATGMVVEKFAKALESSLLPDLRQHYNVEFSRVMP